MIGAWNLPARWRSPCQRLIRLPAPLPPTLIGLVAGVGDASAAESLSLWARTVARGRPDLSVAVLLQGDSFGYLRSIVVSGHLIPKAVATTKEVRSQKDLDSFVETLFRTSLPDAVLRGWVQAYGEREREEPLLRLLSDAAVQGMLVKDALSGSGWCERTARRRLSSLGYPGPGSLLRQGRVLAYDLRVQAGVSAVSATAAGGWPTQSARQRCIRRLGLGRLGSQPQGPDNTQAGSGELNDVRNWTPKVGDRS
jgi:hypothetical protein